LYAETSPEDRHESWNQPTSRNQTKLHQHAPPLPTQLPARADLPACTGKKEKQVSLIIYNYAVPAISITVTSYPKSLLFTRDSIAIVTFFLE